MNTTSTRTRTTRRLIASASVALAAVTTLTVAGSTTAQAGTIGTLDRRIVTSLITESSGLARSTYDRPTVWTHNDSGGTARIYAIGQDGATQAVVTLAGVRARDWEDISNGPDHALWVGDIGDNRKTRSTIQVYKLTEPATLATQTVAATKYELAYPDGRHNAEGLMVHPVTGRVYVVSKSPFGGAIYAAPPVLSTTSVNRLTRVASTPLKITAAAFSPDGSRFALCNYATAYVYRTFGGVATVMKKPSLNQGESLEFTADGTTLLMGSEGLASPVLRTVLPPL